MCKVNLRAHKSDLLKHASTSEHKAAVRAAAARKKIDISSFFEPNCSHVAELELINLTCIFVFKTNNKTENISMPFKKLGLQFICMICKNVKCY